MRGEIEISAVLDAQHDPLGLHSPYGALAVGLDHVVGGQRQVVRLVDQPVMAFDGGALTLGGGGDLGPRSSGLHLRSLHQPLGPADIAQFVGGELVESESLARLQRLPSRRGAGTQLLPPIALQRVDDDGLDRYALVGGGEAAASGGLADLGPVGGAEAGAGMLLGVTICFQQHGPDQEPAQVQHTVQPLAAHGRRPADPFVARGDREGRCGKAERIEHTVVRFHQIAHLGPGMEDGPMGMLAGHQFVPDLALLGRRDQAQLQTRHGLRGGDRLARSRGRPAPQRPQGRAAGKRRWPWSSSPRKACWQVASCHWPRRSRKSKACHT